ncbi:MAG TPA: GyrI-like domain-containing protein [Gemmatimonadales bacterium]|nr:GyrI-like domain-containing protein [Gemmatimonadales bacterium]
MPAARKLDLHRLYAGDYVTPRKPALVATRPGRYLAAAGSGDPDAPAFGEKVGALYAVAYAVKTARKKAGRDFKVAGLEGLWWGVGGPGWMVDQARGTWRWKVLIRMPAFVTAAEVKAAAKRLLAGGKGKAIGQVKLERLAEGRSVQMLHVGPYVDEGPTMDAMLAFAGAKGLRFTGKHHEIYLSDPRRVKPEKLRTILRRPVR